MRGMIFLAAVLLLWLAVLMLMAWRHDQQPTETPPLFDCPACGEPVTTAPPYWTAEGRRFCSRECAWDAFNGPVVPRQREET